MNTIRIAVTLFSVVNVSLFTANLHLRKEFTPVVKTALPYTSSDIDVFEKKRDIITFNTNVTPGLKFRIQVLASTIQVPLFSTFFKGLNDIHEEYVDGRFKYTVGNFSTPGRALPLYLKLQDKGFHDMFIVAYKDGQRIRIKDAEKEMMKRVSL